MPRISMLEFCFAPAWIQIDSSLWIQRLTAAAPLPCEQMAFRMSDMTVVLEFFWMRLFTFECLSAGQRSFVDALEKLF